MSAGPDAAKEREVRCPGCGGRSVFGPSNPSRPFCSPRCRNMDFGAWATEGYRVPAEPSEDQESGDLPPAAGSIRPN